jgi:hypothetical protein
LRGNWFGAVIGKRTPTSTTEFGILKNLLAAIGAETPDISHISPQKKNIGIYCPTREEPPQDI